MSKKKNVVARFGSFEVTKDGNSEHDYLRLRSKSGHWSVSVRDDNPSYGAWLMMCRNPEYTNGLEVLSVMSYIISSTPLDAEFITDFFNAVDAFNCRRVASMPTPTEDENSEAIEEIGLIESIKEKLNNTSTE